jgi:hypothetical protein
MGLHSLIQVHNFTFLVRKALLTCLRNRGIYFCNEMKRQGTKYPAHEEKDADVRKERD